MLQLKNWWQERLLRFEQKIKVRAHTKGSSKTYILPTPFGLGYALLCFLLLLIAVIYQNNLIFLSLFSLVSVALHGMYLTNKIVQKAELQFETQGELFAGSDQAVQFSVVASEPQTSFELEAGVRPIRVQTDLRSHARAQVQIHSSSRGWSDLPLIKMSSTWPFGLFKSWKWIQFSQKILIFPARLGELAFPKGEGDQDGGQSKKTSQENFNGFKPWHPGISYRQIDWRIYSRTKEFLYADFGASHGQVEIKMSLQELRAQWPLEASLSQLTTWIEKANQSGFLYQLDLGNWKSGMSNSQEHRRECLTRLAEYSA
jgi:uncharacterized protein (DUF58 family)